MPTTLLNVGGNRGFSLLQSAIALAVMMVGILILVPRMNDIIEDAWRAHVQSVGTSLQTGVMIFRKVWMTDRNSTLQEGLAINQYGWPVPQEPGWMPGAGVTTTLSCEALWNSLLDIEVPTLTAGDNASADFRVEVVEGHCRYYHRASGDRFYIDYSSADGRVSWNIR
ncbi:hypothetical protein SAMN05421686_107241 [Thalassolituus maritimus]|uniref:MSHA biogenesis protein MshF n=1 Tax=Thalassolituus maritimus TaxID=484498 RepID=A0A1N7NT34_9GAMM|nr:hypothetical protein [Thalassolituus maritimus]SIT01446.1 hypothetical protein SAMN05421686_107241 [Thalassolituus maritimus]